KFVGSDKALDRRIFEKEGFKFSLISANKFPYKPSFGLVKFLVKLKIDLIKTFFLMLSYRPDVVIGFGGYVSCPIILIASLFRIPRIVHEQNMVPGRANKLLFRFADKVAVTFDEACLKAFAGRYAGKCVFTGNPMRREVLKEDRPGGIKRFGLDGSKFTILVVGGSQGAHSLNEAFIGSMAGLDKGSRSDFQVIHLTGIKDYEWAMKSYALIDGLQSRVYSFIDRIEEAYSAADLVVTRSGASAIFEAACFGRPMILVPYPFANAHQLENADYFGGKGAAVVLEEKMLSAEAFKDNILKLYNNKDASRNMAEAARRLSVPDASERLAREVLRLNEY
ncbi:MAG: undecaprenyldiphospho-muramoylpentapeptide beta-N-acetylglucosaminyltransferase, partial [Candidatus Omnitrophica bacterium]|nr:undecaprenyldiphospho-muramoylpentapeptide beta-N-acetylglucosaminyltransferase [Candidatus Omnitrophota bacterium]